MYTIPPPLDDEIKQMLADKVKTKKIVRVLVKKNIDKLKALAWVTELIWADSIREQAEAGVSRFNIFSYLLSHKVDTDAAFLMCYPQSLEDQKLMGSDSIVQDLLGAGNNYHDDDTIERKAKRDTKKETKSKSSTPNPTSEAETSSPDIIDKAPYEGQDEESIINSLNIGGEGNVPKLLIIIDLMITAVLAPLVAIPLLMFYQYLEFAGSLGLIYWEILFWFIAFCIAKTIFFCLSLIPADKKIWDQVGDNPHALWIASNVIDTKDVIAKHKHAVASYCGLVAIFLATFFYYGGFGMYMNNIHSVKQSVVAATNIQGYKEVAQNYRAEKTWGKASVEFGKAANQAGNFDNIDDFSKSILLQIAMDKEQEKIH
jgi:hypothetical protein